jgi:hypothetical protein
MKNTTFITLLITGILIFLLYRYTRKSGPQAKAKATPTKPPYLVPDHAAPRPWIRNQVINPFATNEAGPITSTFELENPSRLVIAWGSPEYYPEYNPDEMEFAEFMATLGNITYSWGDGTSDTIPYLNEAYGITHNYKDPGTYKITVTGENVFISQSGTPFNIVLDNRVKILTVDGCRLDILPNLPAALTSLNCYENNLTSLPDLPAGLKYLDCYGNNIETLPALPAALTYLDCSENQLTTLPPLPAALIQLWSAENSLNSLPEILPAALSELDCSWNQLTTLPELPAALTLLECGNNSLTTLPATLPAALTRLSCGENQLTTLPATLPAALNYLNIYGNQLTTLPATLPAALTMFGCSNNPVTSEAISALLDYLLEPFNAPALTEIYLTMTPPAPPDALILAAFQAARPNIALIIDPQI